MRRRFITIGFAVAAHWAAPGGIAATRGFDDTVKPTLARYCYDCHDDDTQKGGVNLRAFDSARSLQRDGKLWENVFRQIEERTMPPKGKPQPDAAEYHRLVDTLKDLLDNPDPEWQPHDPGVAPPRRLSRAEYNNTIRDLLGVDTKPADRFPPDGGGGGGFDNNADTLFVPPVLMERYLSTAETVLSLAARETLVKEESVWYTPEKWTARRNLAAFATRAFRRPVESEELDRLVGLFAKARREGADFGKAHKVAAKAILVSPRFLFRIEAARPGMTPQKIDDYELGSRLSYFLWASMPDAALLAAAKDGGLSREGGLEEQVRRMLADPRSKEFARQFAGQWLGTRSLAQTASPSLDRFPDYTVELRDAMVEEPVEFFHALLAGNGSVLELVDARYTYANERLAKLYGLAGVKGDDFRKVALADRKRGGILGMAAVLTKTSYPLRTSPVLRGRWILDEVFGTPPPPPPPLVATLPADDKERDGQTLRQRLEAHRKKESCAACHARMDPMGFALENFDPIGRWRDKIDGKPIDASGMLPNGEIVDGPIALKDAVLRKKGLFARHLTEKMLSYALGRGLENYDVPEVKTIVGRLEKTDYRVQTLVMGVVESLPFRFRRPLEIAGEAKEATAPAIAKSPEAK